jgi:hypothetical protein
MPAPVLQFKRGNAGVAGTVPALRPGEPAISLNNFDFFIGIDTSVANNKFFGSHRYWGREDGTNSLKLKLVDKDGSNYVAIAASDTLSGIATYRLPNTNNGSAGDFLKLKAASGGFYNLEWAPVPSGSFTISGDTGTDTFTTGETLTFAGTANEIETAVTNNQVQIGLPNNVIVGGALTVTTGAVIDGVQIGVSGANIIDTVSGNLTLNSAGGQTIIDDLVTIQNNLTVNGNVTVGGTTVTLRGQDVFIENKDIILGYTTSVTPTDDTANHAGVAIASTVGSPLTSFAASGINTFPDTYKQMMWFKNGTLGFGTDAFAFNYGVAIGTTTMVNGVRLAVGSGITMSDTSISATTISATTGNFTNLTGSLTGTISTATSLQNAQNFSITGDFITAPTISFNGTSPVALAATITANSIILGTYTSGDYVASITSGNGLTGGTTGEGSTPTLAVGAGEGITVNADDVALKNGTNLTNNKVLKWDDTNGQLTNTIITENGTSVTIGTGVGITQFSSSVSTGTSTSSVPTSSAVIDYVTNQVGNVDLTLGLNADTGGPSTVNTSQTLTINGTASEVETSVSGQTVTVGLPDAVVVGTSLSAPTLRTGTIQSSNTGATAITIAANDVTIADDLTVQGNLYVNGNTTQVNTTAMTVEDRTIELGVVDGSAPSTTTTWDLGVLFNYYDGSAKKSAVVWEQGDARFKLASVLGADSNGTNNITPQLTVTTFAPIEVSELWINNTCTGGASQVIACSGAELVLQNITVDAGTF